MNRFTRDEASGSEYLTSYEEYLKWEEEIDSDEELEDSEGEEDNYNEDNEDDEESDELGEDFELEEDSLDVVKPELKRRLSALNDMGDYSGYESKQHMIYLKAVTNKFLSEEERLGKILVSCKVVEIFKKMWKALLKKDLFDTRSIDEITIFNLVTSSEVTTSASDKCAVFCRQILKVTLHADIFSYLKFKTLSPNSLDGPHGEIKETLVQCLLSTLFNVVRNAQSAREMFRLCGAVEILQTFREDNNHQMTSVLALMIQSHIVTEDENEKINSGSEVFALLVRLLDYSIRPRDGHNGAGFAVIEIIGAMNKLAANDSNKERIVEQGALPLYVKCLWSDRTEVEQAEAANGLWTLAFTCREQIRKEPGCIEALQKLASESTDDNVKRNAQGALSMLVEKAQDKTLANKPDDTKGSAGGHVFISYSWATKPIVLKLRDKLRAAGYRIWIDEEDMAGNLHDAMATAVEKADVVIICLSHKYKESANCRKEAMYADKSKKAMIPVRVQPGYNADGWLGILTSDMLWFDCSLEEKMEQNVAKLIKELGNRGKKRSDTKLAD